MATRTGQSMTQALSIAGSDSGGGAGVQADLKTFHAHGVFGTSVVTAVTAQNTVAVLDVFELPPEIVRTQIDAVRDDFEIAAAKTGMLGSASMVALVAAVLGDWGIERLVVDPVMVSKSGYALLEPDAVREVRKRLIPLALVVTPNIPEAELLANMRIATRDDMRTAAKRIHRLGCGNVVVKGGHANAAEATDVLFDGRAYRELSAPFIATRNTHGTGCTYSAAITARLALGDAVEDAVAHAKTYVTRAIENALAIGRGHGPTNHFYFIGPDDALSE